MNITGMIYKAIDHHIRHVFKDNYLPESKRIPYCLHCSVAKVELLKTDKYDDFVTRIINQVRVK